MKVQTLTQKMHAEGLRVSAQFSRGAYHCTVTRNGEFVTTTSEPSLHGALLSALYQAPMAHIVTPTTQRKPIIVSF